MLKPKSREAAAGNKTAPAKDEQLADSLSDRTDGSTSTESKLTRLTIALPLSLFDELEEASRKKRRRGEKNWSMSAMVREAVRDFLDTQNP